MPKVPKPSDGRWSVVVPAFNAASTVVDQLDALYREVPAGTEIFVVDDGSTDETASVSRDWSDSHRRVSLEVVSRKVRGGPNSSRNDGLSRSSGQHVAFVDGDDIVGTGWFRAISSAIEEGHAFVGGPAVQFSGDKPLQAELSEDWQLPVWNSERFAYGGNMAVNRDIALAIGGFDESVLLGGTDVEFSIRLRRALDIHPVAVPAAILHHRVPKRPSGQFVRAFRQQQGNAYMRKRFELRDLGHRIALSQLGRGFVPPYSSESVSLLARGSGRLMGIGFWRFRYFARSPRPRLLHAEP